MSQENKLPKVREMDEALIYTHVGAAAKLSCRRNGRRYSGTFAHQPADFIAALETRS